MRNLIHNIEAERVEVYDSRFYTNDRITYYPSSTTILDAYPKGQWFEKWVEDVGGFENARKVRDSAGEAGSNVHFATEAIDEGSEVHWADENGKQFFQLEEWTSILNYLDFKEKVNPVILSTETIMCSENLGFGGTLDRVVEFGGKRWILDIKTSNNISPTFELQLASYAMLWNEVAPPKYQVDATCVLWLKSTTRTDKIDEKKGIWQGRYENCPKNWQIIAFDDFNEAYKDFEHVKAIWKRANPNYKPLNLIYPDKILPTAVL